MKKVNLDVVYKYLESPASFADDEAHEIQNYLIEVKEKLHHLNLQYGVDCEFSEQINTILEKGRVAV